VCQTGTRLHLNHECPELMKQQQNVANVGGRQNTLGQKQNGATARLY
jgi:hypothetical protein